MAEDSVYVIEGVAAVKVGVARDPSQRLRQLQTGSPHPLRLAWSLPISGNAYAVEAEAHRTLARHRAEGEWFKVESAVAVAAVSAAAFEIGVHPSFPERVRGGTGPNWPKRAALVALAFAPGWVAMTAGAYLAAMPLLFLGLIALTVGLHRSRRHFGLGPKAAVGWLGTILSGVAASIIIGLAVGSAHAAERPAFPVFDSETYCSKVVAIFNDNPVMKAGCRANEANARERLEKVWSEPPVDIETQCLKLMGVGSPNNYQAVSGCVALGVGNSWLNGTIKMTR